MSVCAPSDVKLSRSLVGRHRRGQVAFLSQGSRLAKDEVIVDVGGVAGDSHLPAGVRDLEKHRSDAEHAFFQKVRKMQR